MTKRRATQQVEEAKAETATFTKCRHKNVTVIGTDLHRKKYRCNDCGAEGVAEDLGITEG